MQKDKILKQHKEKQARATQNQLLRSDPESSQRSQEDSFQEVLPSPRFWSDDAVVVIEDVQGEIEAGVNKHRGQEEILPLQEPA